MPRYIALLGGINVGGHRVKMDALRAHFAALGFADVTTFIASGNVIFATPEPDEALLKSRIERQLAEALGYSVPTFLRTVEDLCAVAAYGPFADAAAVEAAGGTLAVMFMDAPLPPESAATMLGFATPRDTFHAHGRQLYWLTYGKMSESLIDWRLVGKAVALPPNTMRNATTVRKLAATYGVKDEG